MSLISQPQKLLRGRAGREEDAFLQLMVVARDDPSIAAHLVTILDQEPFQRQSSLNTWLRDLELQRAPRPFIVGLRQLLDDATAARALELLRPGQTRETP